MSNHSVQYSEKYLQKLVYKCKRLQIMYECCGSIDEYFMLTKSIKKILSQINDMKETQLTIFYTNQMLQVINEIYTELNSIDLEQQKQIFQAIAKYKNASSENINTIINTLNLVGKGITTPSQQSVPKVPEVKSVKNNIVEITIEEIHQTRPQSKEIKYWCIEPNHKSTSIYRTTEFSLKWFRQQVKSLKVKTFYYTELMRSQNKLIKVGSCFLVQIYCICIDSEFKTSKFKINESAHLFLSHLKQFLSHYSLNELSKYKGYVCVFKCEALVPIEYFSIQVNQDSKQLIHKSLDIKEEYILRYVHMDSTGEEYKNGIGFYLTDSIAISDEDIKSSQKLIFKGNR
jgi:hypothetical protein